MILARLGDDSYYHFLMVAISSRRVDRLLESMRRIQAAALDLFEARGFAGTTIEAIAEAAGVSAPTVYRHFGTKEGIVLWDDYDPKLFHAVVGPKPGQSLLDALTEQVGAAVDTVMAVDRDRVLRRSRLMERESALRAANVSALGGMRDGLAGTLVRSGGCDDGLEAAVVAGAVTFALEAAVRDWTAARGCEPLGAVVRRALAHLGRLGDPRGPGATVSGGRGAARTRARKAGSKGRRR